MAQAGQQVNVGRPWADAVNGGQRRMRVVGGELADPGQRQLAPHHGARDRLEGPDFRRRQAEPGQPLRPCPHDRRGFERLERGREPPPDRTGAGGRKLLRHDGRGQAGKTLGAPPQRRPARDRDKVLEPRLGLAERQERYVEIAFAAI